MKNETPRIPVENATPRMARAVVRALVSALVGCLAVLAAMPAGALPPARTLENVQKKAVIVGHDAQLYKNSSGNDATEAPFMQIYFLLEGGVGNRVPVTVAPNEENPDGWLDKDSFVEWNTLQMINFEPQSGRELAKIFKDSTCARTYGESAAARGCDELGSEPQRTGQRDDYRLLIPLFERENASVTTFQGGFVRVSMEGPAVVPQTSETPRNSFSRESRGRNASTLGYDLILVVDATASMEEWFSPTNRALQRFIQEIKQQVGGGELNKPFRVGLLFYRDRKIQNDCDIGFLTHWAVDLTDDIGSVTSALLSAREADCGSDEEAEAVYDALNRALLDPGWEDGHFKVVLLVGDAPPHDASNADKNPLAFNVDKITEMSAERNVRFLTFKIKDEDKREFQMLAESVEESVLGRFRSIDGQDKAAYEEDLHSAMLEEWELLTKADAAATAGVDPKQLQKDPALQRRFNIDDYELPIIVANLPPTSSGERPPEFVEGWAPEKIKGKLAVGEYVFMRKTQVTILTSVVEAISAAAEEGRGAGSESFISILRQSLAAMLKLQPDELFRSGESLASMMQKANILPFRTTALSFTAEEVNTWKPEDYDRLNTLMSEKIDALREYTQKPGNLRYFGDKPHMYVPRNLFP